MSAVKLNIACQTELRLDIIAVVEIMTTMTLGVVDRRNALIEGH